MSDLNPAQLEALRRLNRLGWASVGRSNRGYSIAHGTAAVLERLGFARREYGGRYKLYTTEAGLERAPWEGTL